MSNTKCKKIKIFSLRAKHIKRPPEFLLAVFGATHFPASSYTSSCSYIGRTHDYVNKKNMILTFFYLFIYKPVFY